MDGDEVTEAAAEASARLSPDATFATFAKQFTNFNVIFQGNSILQLVSSIIMFITIYTLTIVLYTSHCKRMCCMYPNANDSAHCVVRYDDAMQK